jgi:O-antigen/teichoic acid export membrane protein
LLGAAQGLELFGWVSFTSAASGLLKLLLVFFFILVGYRTSGALFALFISSIAVVLILTFPLRQYINFKIKKEEVNYSKIFGYLVPVAIAQLCFMLLVNFDMLLVKYYFTAPLAGTYSFAQMVGKIFLFLPAAVSIVMFPKTSGLKVKNMDTSATLKRSLWYVFSLCLLALIAYNILPSLALRILTGRSYPETVLLGRAFSVSMSFFTLLYVLVCYFLSLDDFRFIRYLFGLTVLQIIAIALFHRSLIQVQLILCANAALAFLIHLRLAFSPSQKSSRI